jgi:hypothetical protein
MYVAYFFLSVKETLAFLEVEWKFDKCDNDERQASQDESAKNLYAQALYFPVVFLYILCQLELCYKIFSILLKEILDCEVLTVDCIGRSSLNHSQFKNHE